MPPPASLRYRSIAHAASTDPHPPREAPRVGAYLVARDERGRVLLVLMRGGPFKGEWLLPGGGVEPGESTEDAVRREVREETGLQIDILAPTQRYDVRSLKQPGFHFEMHGFRGSVSGQLRAEQGSDARWCEPALDLHPVLLRELADEGIVSVDRDDLRRRLRAAGVEMKRLR